MGAYFIEGKPYSPERLSPGELIAKAKKRRDDALRTPPGLARQSILLEARQLESQAAVEELLRAAELRPQMKHITNRTWTPEQDALLIKLAESGASVARASVALKRSQVATKNRARRLGVELKSLKEKYKAIAALDGQQA